MLCGWFIGLRAATGERWRSVVWGGGLSILAGLSLWWLDPGESVANLSYDLSTVMLPVERPEGVMIVYMDEESYQTLKQTWGVMWDRSLHAQLLDRLREDRAKLAVFDVFLADPGGSPTNDLRLAEAISGFGRVVLAADRVKVHAPNVRSVEQTVPPLDLFRNAARSWGIARLDTGGDYGVRRHFGGTDLTPSLAWAAFEQVERLDGQIRSESQGHAVSASPAGKRTDDSAAKTPPSTRLKERWIRYYGPEGTVPGISYARALQARRKFFEGQIVFVGGKPQTRFLSEERESFFTPFTRWNEQFTTGVEIHASTFLNLLRRDWMRRLSGFWEFMILLALGALFGGGLRLLSPAGAVGGALAGALGMLLVAWTLAVFGRLWFPWMVVVGLQIPCGLLCAVVAHATARPEAKLGPALFVLPGSARTRPLTPDFTLRRCLREEAQCETWLAESAGGGYRMIKLLRHDLHTKASGSEQEWNGLQRLAVLSSSHPGLLPILSVGRSTEHRCFYYTMEAADDEQTGRQIQVEQYEPKSLRREISRRGRIQPEECLEIGLALVATLDHLHHQGAPHGNVKPSNVLYLHGAPKLSDARWRSGRREKPSEASREHNDYAPPEPLSTAADIYSLGLVLYAALTGLGPERFPEPCPETVEPGDSELTQSLERIIFSACQKEPGHRYKSAAEMHAALLLAMSLHVKRKQATQLPAGKGGLECVGEHMLIQRIGRGAYGEVWLGRNQVGIYRAVKLIHRARFPHLDPYEREFEGVKNFMGISMRHPGFLKVLHVGRNEELKFFFYVMEAGDDEISGQKIDPNNYRPKTLAGELRRRGALPAEECLALMLDLTAALDELHRLQYVHRDLKPSNILFVEGQPKLGDIGLVATIGERTVVGTPNYMAPEGLGTPSSDLYSLGKVLYSALTNQPPDQFPRLPSKTNGSLTPKLVGVMLKACAADAAARYQTAAEMRADLLTLKASSTGPDEPTQVEA
jgi:serine/threonine protein kinase/CHASE2 domain-containing sensor protein